MVENWTKVHKLQTAQQEKILSTLFLSGDIVLVGAYADDGQRDGSGPGFSPDDYG